MQNKAAGAAILSAVNSPPQMIAIQDSRATNQLNSIELVEFLNMRFSCVLTAYHDTNLDTSSRPEKYETVPEKAWTKPVWGPKQRPHGLTANGLDFLTELSK